VPGVPVVLLPRLGLVLALSTEEQKKIDMEHIFAIGVISQVTGLNRVPLTRAKPGQRQPLAVSLS
jgi:hypothetical protein